MLKLIRDYITYRKAVTSLKNLSDRDLQDVGISRADIENVLRPNYSETIKGLFGDSKNPVEDYLSRSQDHADLERRQRELMKRGII